jgi:hypothetical protein
MLFALIGLLPLLGLVLGSAQVPNPGTVRACLDGGCTRCFAEGTVEKSTAPNWPECLIHNVPASGGDFAGGEIQTGTGCK